MLDKEIEFPLFPIGRYRANDGSEVEFDEATLQAMARNTNFAIESGILRHPPIGYDHPAEASASHGVLTGARYSNGVLYVKGSKWSDQLVKDARQFKRLTYSGEFASKLAGVINGKSVEVGPTIVGVAMLGAKRAAVKNPAMRPLADFGFGEKTAPIDAFMASSELKRAGVVALGSEGAQHFAEVDNGPKYFDEGSNDMDKDEAQKLIDAAIAANDKKWEQRLTDQTKEFNEKLSKNTVDSKRQGDVKEFAETVGPKGDKKINMTQKAKLESILMHPSVATSTELDQLIRQFVEAGSSISVGREIAGKKSGSGKPKELGEHDVDDDEDGDEDGDGGALDTIQSKAFAEMSKGDNERLVGLAVKQFSERFPEKVRDDAGKPLSYELRLAKAQKYVQKRELSED